LALPAIAGRPAIVLCDRIRYGIVRLAGFKALVSFGVHGGGVSGHRRTSMFATLLKLWKNEDGATAIEYGLIAALIAVAAISAMQLVGSSLTATFNNIASKL
jgi:pilus assembly protein Flp/PilA